VSGASGIENMDEPGGGKRVRQSHFRFLDEAGREAHHKLCEFYDNAEPARQRSDDYVDFGKGRSPETVAVRDLICRGIAIGVFDQADIRAMRQWYFDLKAANRFEVAATPEVFSWLRTVQQRGYQSSFGLGSMAFAPEHGDLPGYDWKEAARLELARANQDVLDGLRGISVLAFTRAAALAKQAYGSEEFDRIALEPYYKPALELATFLAVHGGVDAGKIRPREFGLRGAPKALLAFCAPVAVGFRLAARAGDLAVCEDCPRACASGPHPRQCGGLEPLP